MTRLTTLRIKSDPEVIVSSFWPVDGKFGLYIGTIDLSPSGCERSRPLLTSEPVYPTAAEAVSAGQSIIDHIRAAERECN